ncbi:MAG: aminotransferase class IV [Desulfamplus sp.]|nr:aminotransferase class IV [Desulfamplus sp.]
MDTYYIDGAFVNDDQARISVKDIALLRGYGIFDFLITYNRRPFHLEAHVARFENSAREIGLKIHHKASEICAIVLETLKKNPHHTESNIRMLYTGGVSNDGITPCDNGTLMVMVTPKYEPPAQWYSHGAAIVTADMERIVPAAKSTNYLSAVLAQQMARKKDAIEAVYVDRDNNVLEGTTSNIFCFKGSSVITPPDGILPGITREVVLDIIKEKMTGVSLGMRHIPMSELGEMDEIFISSSNKEIVPIVKVDEMMVGSGMPGEGTRRIMELFREYTNAYGRGEIS